MEVGPHGTSSSKEGTFKKCKEYLQGTMLTSVIMPLPDIIIKSLEFQNRILLIEN